MHGIYPDYADKVNVYAVSYDTFGDISKLDKQRQEQGWLWPVAMPVGTMLRDQGIVIWATKIAFDSNGVITYRAGPAQGTDDDFRTVLGQLAASG